MKSLKKQFDNPFYASNSLSILLFFTGWGIWWSFFQIWLTSKQGFSGSQVGTIYSFNSAITLILIVCLWFYSRQIGNQKDTFDVLCRM